MLFVVFVTASAYRTSTSVVHAPAPGTAARSLQQGGLRAQQVDVGIGRHPPAPRAHTGVRRQRMRGAVNPSYADAMKVTDTPAGRDEDGRKISWGVFIMVVVGVLCIGIAAGFGVSERLQQRELLWRWLLDRSERTIEDVAYRFGELWLQQLRLDVNSPHYDALEARISTQRELLERLGREMVDDKPTPECTAYPGRWERLRVFDPYLLPNLRSTRGGAETEIIFVNCTGSEIAYYWVDRDGVERYYGRIAPKSDAIQHSFEGHIWVAKNSADVDLSVFRAARSVSVALITGEVPSRILLR